MTGLVAYAMATSVVAAAAIGSLEVIGQQVDSMFQTVAAALQAIGAS